MPRTPRTHAGPLFWVPEPKLEAAAAALYNDALPYHNFRVHIPRLLDRARFLLERCQRAQIPVNGQVVYRAILGHDGGYDHTTPSAERARSKEAYAKWLFLPLLREAKVPDPEIVAIGEAILTTERGAIARTNEAKVVRAADLMGLTQPYEGFLQDNLLLHEEEELLGGHPIPWSQWKRMTEKVLQLYLLQDIRVVCHEDPTKKLSIFFHDAARANLEQFLADPLSVD